MQILTTKEAAEMLRLDKRTMQRRAQKNVYPKYVCSQIGKQYRFIKEELLKFHFKKALPIGE